MLSNPNIISCNSPFSPSPQLKLFNSRSPFQSPLKPQSSNSLISTLKVLSLKPCHQIPFPALLSSFRRWGVLKTCHSSLNTENSNDPVFKEGGSGESKVGNGGGGGGGGDWTTSILLFGLWGVLMYYVFNLAPNQTPELSNFVITAAGLICSGNTVATTKYSAVNTQVNNARTAVNTQSRDMYFLEKLLNLKGDDGFKMNEVLVALWYIMGLWPLVYSLLLLPSGRSSKSNIPVWPFLVLSCFGGAYALLPYFVLWRPPPPPVEEAELGKWPLNFMESKLTAGIMFAAGLGIITYAGLANGETWGEFYQYFRESKFIHVTCLDFTLLSTFAPFWVYNDMTARKWSEKSSWVLPLSLIPFLGPALYLVLRPRLSELPMSLDSNMTKGD
ncbi:hypothetical protein GIB67_001039 [Kingdonia uniflora]|uniref:Uncharacterized protein n=1 Tax=Kingdonia uniflora TaxID=39325 RepID=A0A7J7MFZ7_9MAGN|nr:hypothetical protein GIB67_001039 [Kingdonia uniflora]